MTYNMRFEL